MLSGAQSLCQNAGSPHMWHTSCGDGRLSPLGGFCKRAGRSSSNIASLLWSPSCVGLVSQRWAETTCEQMAVKAHGPPLAFGQVHHGQGARELADSGAKVS